MLHTLLGQISPALHQKEKNITKIAKAVSSGEYDIAVFCEMFLTGYSVRDSLPRLAESIDGPSVCKISKIAQEHGTHIIFGMPESCGKRRGLVYNSAVLTTPDGSVKSYRKLYLANFGPFEEKQYFAPGNDVCIFHTKIGCIGLMICYDLFFPELAKSYALQGADILIDISASPSTTRPFFETALATRAIETTTFVLYSNLVGTEHNMVFWGGCQAYSPRGNRITCGKYFEEELVKMDLDLKELDIARRFRPTLKDTRMDVLDGLRNSF